jgi:hypothetical protein
MQPPVRFPRSRAVFVVLLLLCSAGIASAQEQSTVGVAVSVSTLGYSLESATQVAPNVNVRGQVNLLYLSHDFETDGITLASDMKMRSVMAYVDWFPFGGRFHLSPGLMIYNGNKADAVASVPAGQLFDLGDQKNLVSDPAAPVSGDAHISFGRVAPAFVVGWGSLLPQGNRRWTVPVNFGFVYARPPEATLSLIGRACQANGTNCRSIATDSVLQTELRKREATLNDDLSPLRFLPVISVGLAYRF